MRPIDKGAAPRAYAKYQDAGTDLVDRIGDYCSYCERQIETNLAVEHIQPKSGVPALINDWANFLLACNSCNSCKGATAIALDDYFWPDKENTLLAFDYQVAGRIHTHPNLPLAEVAKAELTIALLGLDREPGHPDPNKRPTRSDKRWLRREEAWTLAHRSLTWLTTKDSPEMRESIVEIALGRGMFSIWLTVFEQDADMRCRLIQAFRGTAIACFDAQGLAVSRAGGRL